MSLTTLLIALASLAIKHAIVDFGLQTQWILRAKGRYCHPGGLVHAGLHAAGSAPVLLWAGASWPLALTVALAEFVIHYHIDWAKEQITSRAGWTSGQTAFWFAIGVDQCLHQLTYLGMLATVAFALY